MLRHFDLSPVMLSILEEKGWNARRGHVNVMSNAGTLIAISAQCCKALPFHLHISIHALTAD